MEVAVFINFIPIHSYCLYSTIGVTPFHGIFTPIIFVAQCCILPSYEYYITSCCLSLHGVSNHLTQLRAACAGFDLLTYKNQYVWRGYWIACQAVICVAFYASSWFSKIRRFDVLTCPVGYAMYLLETMKKDVSYRTGTNEQQVKRKRARPFQTNCMIRICMATVDFTLVSLG